MGSGNRHRVTQSQRAEFGTGNIRVDAVDLVGHHETTLVALAQVLANHLIGGRQPSLGVDQEQHGIGLFDGQQRLLGHLGVDTFLVAGNPPGVDDDERTTLPLGLAILTVTGQAGVFRDDGITALGQTVEQRRLADIGAAHQGNYRNHRAPPALNPENTKAAARAAATIAGRLQAPRPTYLMVRATSLPSLP